MAHYLDIIIRDKNAHAAWREALSGREFNPAVWVNGETRAYRRIQSRCLDFADQGKHGPDLHGEAYLNRFSAGKIRRTNGREDHDFPVTKSPGSRYRNDSINN